MDRLDEEDVIVGWFYNGNDEARSLFGRRLVTLRKRSLNIASLFRSRCANRTRNRVNPCQICVTCMTREHVIQSLRSMKFTSRLPYYFCHEITIFRIVLILPNSGVSLSFNDKTLLPSP